MRILLTSTSFQDTPGKHQELLNTQGFEIDTLRGPVKEELLLPIIGNYDGIICGDDEITSKVIEAGTKGNLKIISKYGIGLDKIDTLAANTFNIPVTNCPGVNQITVAEHFFALLLAFYKNLHIEYNITKQGKWERLIGHELYGKTIAILGLGRIGKEIAIRASSFGLKIKTMDKFPDTIFCGEYKLEVCNKVEELVDQADIVSLNLSLDKESESIINQDLIGKMKDGVIIVNTARGKLVDLNAIINGLRNKNIGGYLTDVLEEEPMKDNHPLLDFDNVIITPHIGSRTYESVERQGTMAVENLLKHLK